MEILFSKKNIDVKKEIEKKIENDIEKLTIITEENIILYYDDIFKKFELEPLNFDIDKTVIEFNKNKPVSECFLKTNGVDYDGDLFFGTIYLCTDLVSGTKSLLLNKPIDFKVNPNVKGYFDNKNKIHIEFPTSIYNVDLKFKEDIDKFNLQKGVLKNYLVNGMNEINKEIPYKNTEIKEKILELLNAKKEKLSAIEERNKLLN
ncbi:hypothetical protein [Flavobacterium sp. TSSA_36]|uniref:hypothetical protein n=1 Tax=Flavobacterium sp. TSSA_36 TaxID=3447669 RepID=UPI003F36D61F